MYISFKVNNSLMSSTHLVLTTKLVLSPMANLPCKISL